jgi:hypothetical protein
MTTHPDGPDRPDIPRLILRLEGAALLIAAAGLFSGLNSFSWIYGLAFVAPDLSFFGYLAGPRIGARIYNAAHTTLWPLLLGLAGWSSGNTPWMAVALVWLAHIGFDRMLGYGLKYEAGFTHTHLGRIGGAEAER